MNRNFKKLSLLLTSCGVVALGAGCSGPGTTNNDQGIAVTHLGFFSALSTSCTTLPAGVAGFSLQMSTAKPEPNSTLGNGSLAGVDAGSNLVAVVGVQNNLYRQAFRADRVIYDYFIAGASIQPPSTNVAINLLAGPGSAATGGTTGGTTTTDPTNGGRNPIGSSLPPSFAGLCNRAYAQAYVIPASIREWINFNRDSLPEPPFMLEVTARISGVSTSGDRFETQPATIPVSIVEEILITPTEGGDTGTNGLTDGSTTDGSTTDGSTSDASLTDGENGDGSAGVTGLEDVISDAQNGDSEGVSTDL